MRVILFNPAGEPFGSEPAYAYHHTYTQDQGYNQMYSSSSFASRLVAQLVIHNLLTNIFNSSGSECSFSRSGFGYNSSMSEDTRSSTPEVFTYMSSLPNGPQGPVFMTPPPADTLPEEPVFVITAPKKSPRRRGVRYSRRLLTQRERPSSASSTPTASSSSSYPSPLNYWVLPPQFNRALGKFTSGTVSPTTSTSSLPISSHSSHAAGHSIQCLWSDCKCSFPGTKQGLDEHFKTYHGFGRRNGQLANVTVCQWVECGKTMEPEAMRRHVHGHSGVARKTCSACGVDASRIDALARHVGSTECGRCPTCAKQFRHVEEKVQHQRICEAKAVAALKDAIQKAQAASPRSGTERLRSRTQRKEKEAPKLASKQTNQDKAKMATARSVAHIPTISPSKKRTATRKGWKGWVELSDEEELLESNQGVDHVEVMAKRATRSGLIISPKATKAPGTPKQWKGYVAIPDDEEMPIPDKLVSRVEVMPERATRSGLKLKS